MTVQDDLLAMPNGISALLKTAVMDRLGHRATMGQAWREIEIILEEDPDFVADLERVYARIKPKLERIKMVK